jgi:hypothetical protein
MLSLLRPGPPTGLFPFGFPTQILYAVISMRAKCPAHLILLDLIVLTINGEECTFMKFLTVDFRQSRTIFFFWFVWLLALWPLLAYCASLG